jgi:hypothetical protein
MPSTLAQKLQMKTPHLLVLNVPTGYLDTLAAELPGITVSDAPVSAVDAVLLFVNGLDEANRLMPQAIAAVKSEGLLWVAYPKGSSGVKTDVNRDRLWQALEPTGWRPVRQVALDENWSAMRFRPGVWRRK